MRQPADAVPAAVLRRLAAAFEPPQPAKHQWEAAHTLVVDCSGSSSCTKLEPAVGYGVVAAAAHVLAAGHDVQETARCGSKLV